LHLAILLHMQPVSKPDIAGFLDGLVAQALPGRRGLGAWRALLTAHATLMRRLATDLQAKTGLSLGDFDVLAQLAEAGGALRMTELADRTLSSRSGMTRRIDRMVDEGVVRRASADDDARGVVVALTDAGLGRLAETAPIHLRGVSELFVERLDDQDVAALESALKKVTLDCGFG
jgi:DNA-binding MarR family transcriptional regulator